MILPYPFSRGVFIYGEPIYVDAKATAEQMREKKQELEEALNRMTSIADNYFG